MNTYDRSTLARRLEALRAAVELALDEKERDERYWEDVATGQDSEQAEHTGYISGLIDGLEAARRLIEGGEDITPNIAGLGDHS